MPIIDRQTPAVTEAGPAQTGAANLLNRQGWLNALESAGWRDALRAGRPFLAPEAATAEPGDRASWQPTPASGNKRQEADEAPAPSATDAYPPGANAPGGAVDSSARRVGDSAAERPPVLAIFWEPKLGADVPDHETAGATRDPSATAESRRQWQARNLVILPSEQGMEVWIRDSHLGESQLPAVLGTLRKTMAELGSSLVRVSLNGQPVQLPAQEKLGQRKPKEG